MRRAGVQGSNACVGRVTTEGYPGLGRSRDCEAQWPPPRVCAQHGLRSAMGSRQSAKHIVIRSTMVAFHVDPVSFTLLHSGCDANFRYPCRAGSCSISDASTADSVTCCWAMDWLASHSDGRRLLVVCSRMTSRSPIRLEGETRCPSALRRRATQNECVTTVLNNCLSFCTSIRPEGGAGGGSVVLGGRGASPSPAGGAQSAAFWSGEALFRGRGLIPGDARWGGLPGGIVRAGGTPHILGESQRASKAAKSANRAC